MPGEIRFDKIPQLPADWWEQDDAASVWPTWGRETDYFWGANLDSIKAYAGRLAKAANDGV